MAESGSLSLRFKLSAVVVTVIVAVMAGFAYVAQDYLTRTATEETVRQLSATNRLIRDLIASSQEGLRLAVGRLGETLQANFAGRFELHARRIESEGVSTPLLTLNGRPLNYAYQEIDRFSRDSGGNVATIFVRDGDDFVRINTSLTKEDGSRAVGTRLGRSHPGYVQLSEGLPYHGYARLFGKPYMTEYLPIRDGAERVIGLLFVGMDLTPSLNSLRQKLRQFVIGGSGYIVVIDAEPGSSQGELLVHPTRQGQNLLLGPPSPESEIVERVLHQRNGIMFYDWINREMGEQEPRRKVLALDEYPELDWVIASTGYLDEFMRTPLAGKNFMIAATVTAALLLIVVLNAAVGRLVVLPMWREIAERKRAEEEIRREHALRKKIIESLPGAFCLFDGEGRFLEWNDNLEAMTGRSAEEIEASHPIDFFSGEGRAELEKAIGRAFETGQASVEAALVAKDGRATPFLFIGVRTDWNGRPALIGLGVDITLQKQAQRVLQDQRGVLEEMVRERTEQLELAKNEAERLARVKSEFLANMSHEIRTPLNGVLGLAHLGHRNADAGSKARETFAQILESGKLLLGVINDILDFSKIEAGKLHVEQEPVNLDRLIAHVVELSAGRAYAKGIDLRVEKIAGFPASCLSDQVRLQQILMNLLANAVKFTDAGSVTLTADRQGDQLVFKVSDTGIGMSEDQIGRLFTPFEQADNSTTRRFGGTGLGLSITSRLVSLMGGDIRVKSELRAGSCFEVRLPFKAVPVSAAKLGERAKDGPTTPIPRLSGISILVAEDNEINRIVLEDNLLTDGARVVMVTNGKEAVERIRRDGRAAYDIVLMDIQMPEMDGYEATHRILEIAPDLPIVGQTAHAMAEERQKCLAAGMVDHVAKPIDPEELVTVIRRHAGRRQLAG